MGSSRSKASNDNTPTPTAATSDTTHDTLKEDYVLQIKISESIEDPSLDVEASGVADSVVRRKLFLQRCLQTDTYMLQVDNELPRSDGFAASELDYFVENAADGFVHQVNDRVVFQCDKSEDGIYRSSIHLKRGPATFCGQTGQTDQTENTDQPETTDQTETTDSFYRFEINGDSLAIAVGKLAEQSEEVAASLPIGH